VLLGLLTLLLAAWCYEVPLQLANNPFDSAVQTQLAALTGFGTAVFIAMMFGNPMSQLERIIPQAQLRRLRRTWLATLIVTLGLAGTIVFAVRGAPWSIVAVHWRDIAQGVALACLSACVIPRAAAWTVPAIALAACWLAGTKDMQAGPRLFAFPCYPAYSITSWVVTAIALAAAFTLYARRDAFPED